MSVFKPEIQNYIKTPFSITRLSDVALERLCNNVNETLEQKYDNLQPDFIKWLHSAKQIALEERARRLIGCSPGYKESTDARATFHKWDDGVTSQSDEL